MRPKARMKFTKLFCILIFTFIAASAIAQTTYSSSNDDLRIEVIIIDGVDSYDTARLVIRADTNLIYPTQHIGFFEHDYERAKELYWIIFDNEQIMPIPNSTKRDYCFDYSILIKGSKITLDYLIPKDRPFFYLTVSFYYYPVDKFFSIKRNRKFIKSNDKEDISLADQCLFHKAFQKNKSRLDLGYEYNFTLFLEALQNYKK